MKFSLTSVLNFFFFIGPTGTLFILSVLDSFRLFYFFSPFVLLVLLMQKFLSQQVKWTFLFLLFYTSLIIFSFFSAPFELFSTPYTKAPFLRVLIHLINFYCFIFLSLYFRKKGLQKLLDYSMWGYIVTLIIGFLFYILFINGFINFKLFSMTTFLPQSGYGFWRFSPGTYPNEWGVISSFFTLLILMKLHKKPSLNFTFYLFLSFIGMVLATTKAAYLCFAVCFAIYIVTNLDKKGFIAAFIGLLSVTGFLFKSYILIFIEILVVGFGSIKQLSGSSLARVEELNTFWDLFKENFVFGLGFELQGTGGIHNNFVGYFFQFGIIGFVLLVTVFILFFAFISTQKTALEKTSEIKYSLLFLGVHFFLFGLTNHNKNHFLTLFFFSLLFAYFGPAFHKMKQ